MPDSPLAGPNRTVICPDCGENITRREDRLERERQAIEARLRMATIAHAEERVKWMLREVQLEAAAESKNRKVRAQRRRLNQLEAKLRNMGVKPYEDLPEANVEVKE